MWFGEGMGWWAIIGILWMLVFWGGIIALVVWVVLKLTRHGAGNGPRRDFTDIARELYAKGEISKEEFEQLKKDLR